MKPILLTAALLLLGAPVLGGCGFTPLHATSAGQTTFNDVAVTVRDGRDENDRAAGFQLRQTLNDRIGNDADGRYALDIVPNVRQIGLGLTGQDRASRFDSVLSARWTLKEAATGRVVARGNSTSTATYSADQDPYRRLSAAEAGVQRVTREVADTILAEVALALADAKTSAAP